MNSDHLAPTGKTLLNSVVIISQKLSVRKAKIRQTKAFARAAGRTDCFGPGAKKVAEKRG
jgi:hypothetical protein